VCDGNLAYQLSLPEAIAREWLAPFWYVGVFDPIDYTQVRWRQSHYDEEELLRLQTGQSHLEAVFSAWAAHHQTRTLAFCSSVQHAAFLSKEFSRRGARSTWVHAASGLDRRRQVLEDLARGQLDIVFSVDLFNEGIDIPAADTILMVRPTGSSIVFIQQLGRGLRLHSGKTHCTVIDLIGNYRNADAKLQWLGVKNPAALATGGLESIRTAMPPSCRLDMDVEVIDVLRRMIRQQTPRKILVLDAYERLREELGRSPSYLEFHLQGRLNDSRMVRQEFHAFAGLKRAAGDLSFQEVDAWDRYHAWIEESESTAMVKSYKMVLLEAMLARGPIGWTAPITATQAAPYFHRYLTGVEYRKRIDFSDKTTRSLWEYQERGVASLIRRNPMTQWSQSTAGWVSLDSEGFQIHLPEAGAETLTTLHKWAQQVADYRLHTYFERKASKMRGPATQP
jgi:hypothetical protein